MSHDHRRTRDLGVLGRITELARLRRVRDGLLIHIRRSRTIGSRLPRYSGSPREQAGLAILTLANTSLGLGMLFEAARWSATPAYGILLQILSAHVWGTMYLAVAAVMACSIWWHRSWPLAFTAHVAGMALHFGWWIAFVVRWATDDKTTNVNMTSWGVYLVIGVWSFLLLNQRKAQGRFQRKAEGRSP